MNIVDLEELLAEFLPSGFRIDTNKKGEVVIFTNLKKEPLNEELVEFDSSDYDFDEDSEDEPEFEDLDEDSEYEESDD